ncbi:MAG: CoA-transferase [Thermoplasmatales archaeon]
MDRTSRIKMIMQAAKEIKDGDVVLVGVGLPNIAANVAKKLYSPNMVMTYESGSIDCAPQRQPLSIGDPSLSENVSCLYSIFDIFSYLIVGGRINVGYLGAAQIDPDGNLNTTVIGNYDTPDVRLPGSGGACEILHNAKKSVIMMEFTESKFKSRVDFITSSRGGDLVKGDDTGKEEVIVTDKCVIRIREKGRAEISAVYRDVKFEELKILSEKLGIILPENVSEIDEPTENEMNIIESIDKTVGPSER